MTLKAKRVIKIISAVLLLLVISLISLAYVQYRDLKKVLAGKISDKATLFIGQKVIIEDLSFSPTSGINLYNITVKNPAGFVSGELLRIKKIFIKIKYSELPQEKFYFRNITVYSPELTVLRNDKGRMNISDKLKDFFKRKSTMKYQVDEFTIKSGSVDFNQDKKFRNDNITIYLKDLSSTPGMKTMIQANTICTGGTKISINGWAYLKNNPKRLNVTISSQAITLRTLKDFLGRYTLDTEKTKLSFNLNAEGDTEKGLSLKSEIGIKNAGLSFFKKDIENLLLNAHAFLNIRENALSIENMSLYSGGVTAASLSGAIKKVQEDFLYTARLKIIKIDVSSFNFMKNVKISGLMRSENLHLQGSLKKILPEISGVVQMSAGAFKSKDIDIEGINAQVTFLPSREITAQAGATAKVSKFFGHLLEEPAGVTLHLTAHGNPGNMVMKSSVDLSPVALHIKSGKKVSSDSVAVHIRNTIQNKVFTGESQIEMKNIQYGNYQIPSLQSNAIITFSGNIIKVEKPTVDGDGIKISADCITATLPDRNKNHVTLEIQDMNVSNPSREVEIKKAALSLHTHTGGEGFLGDVGFSIGEIMFRGMRIGSIQGNGRFDDKDFSLDIPRSEVSGGSINLSIKGKISDGFFPLTVKGNAENIDMGNLSGEVSKNSTIPYVISGNFKRGIFEGAIHSQESMEGKAEIQAEKIAVLNKDKRNIIHGVSLKGELTVRGEDIDFKSDADAGKISAKILGSVKKFAKKDRAAEIRILQQEAKAGDMRELFWEIFPDSFLYSGLDGYLSSDLLIQYTDSVLKVNGQVTLKNFVLQGENAEYSAGPVSGVFPVVYSKTNNPSSPPIDQEAKEGFDEKKIRLQSFELSEFDNLRRQYAQKFQEEGYSKITIGSLIYGFEFLQDIEIWIKQEGNVLNVKRFSGNIFGGRLYGSAVVDVSDVLTYRAGIHLDGLSLTKLCESIEPIKGYISGKVNGIATLKGGGMGIPQLIGKAEFWSYSTKDETTKISREFLKKIGGPSLKAYLGDRLFDKGTVRLYLQKGFIIFDELEISNKNIIGMKDLTVKVAPFNNRISIDNLMWSITEAAQRGKKDQ